jgi:hypothetical protein
MAELGDFYDSTSTYLIADRRLKNVQLVVAMNFCGVDLSRLQHNRVSGKGDKSNECLILIVAIKVNHAETSIRKVATSTFGAETNMIPHA